MKRVTIFFMLAVILFCSMGCSSDNEEKQRSIELKDFFHSGCKQDADTIGTKSGEGFTEYIEYEADKDGYLLIKHMNTLMNCCSDSIYAKISISGNKLSINEIESAPKCNCVCKYDLRYAIGSLSTQEYKFQIYRGNLEIAKFSFTYHPFLNGKYNIQN